MQDPAPFLVIPQIDQFGRCVQRSRNEARRFCPVTGTTSTRISAPMTPWRGALEGGRTPDGRPAPGLNGDLSACSGSGNCSKKLTRH